MTKPTQTAEEVENVRRWARYVAPARYPIADVRRDVRRLLATLDAERAAAEALRAALTDLDATWQWVAENAPRVLVEMPADRFAAFDKARAALGQQEPDR